MIDKSGPYLWRAIATVQPNHDCHDIQCWCDILSGFGFTRDKAKRMAIRRVKEENKTLISILVERHYDPSKNEIIPYSSTNNRKK